MRIKYIFLYSLLFFIVISCDEESNCEECPENQSIHGCLDSQACNYNPDANIDNNSCEYPVGACECDQDEDDCSIVGAWRIVSLKNYDEETCSGDDYENNNPEFEQYYEFDDNGDFTASTYFLGSCASITGSYIILSDSDQNQNIYSDYTILVDVDSDIATWFFSISEESMTIWVHSDDDGCSEIVLNRSSPPSGC